MLYRSYSICIQMNIVCSMGVGVGAKRMPFFNVYATNDSNRYLIWGPLELCIVTCTCVMLSCTSNLTCYECLYTDTATATLGYS